MSCSISWNRYWHPRVKTTSIVTWAKIMADIVTNKKKKRRMKISGIIIVLIVSPLNSQPCRQWATRLNILLCSERTCYRRLDAPISASDELDMWKSHQFSSWKHEVSIYLGEPSTQQNMATVVSRLVKCYLQRC